MRRVSRLVLLAGLLSACCFSQSQLDQIWKRPAADAPAAGLGNDKITAGLKEALKVSTGKAVAATGRPMAF